jgi:hypothetical protein
MTLQLNQNELNKQTQNMFLNKLIPFYLLISFCYLANSYWQLMKQNHAI